MRKILAPANRRRIGFPGRALVDAVEHPPGSCNETPGTVANIQAFMGSPHFTINRKCVRFDLSNEMGIGPSQSSRQLVSKFAKEEFTHKYILTSICLISVFLIF